MAIVSTKMEAGVCARPLSLVTLANTVRFLPTRVSGLNIMSVGRKRGMAYASKADVWMVLED